jgi:hypothetical protein
MSVVRAQDVEADTGEFTQLLNMQNARKNDPNMDKKGLVVLFEVIAVQSEAKSQKEGRPIYDEVDSIKIYAPGDRHNVVHRQILPNDKVKFAQEYVAWKQGRELSVVGTPLEAWPVISKGQIEELKFFHVRTVEQLAALTDGNAQNVGPILRIRQTARDWLAAAEDGKHVSKLRGEIHAKDNEILTLQRQVKQLGDSIEKLRRRADADDEEDVVPARRKRA